MQEYYDEDNIYDNGYDEFDDYNHFDEHSPRTNAGQGLGIAGLVVGIVALLISFIPCVGVFALVPGIIAIVLSSIGLSQANKNNGEKGIIIAGLVVSILSTIIAAVWAIFMTQGARELNKLKNEFEKETLEQLEKELDKEELDKTLKHEFGYKKENTDSI